MPARPSRPVVRYERAMYSYYPRSPLRATLHVSHRCAPPSDPRAAQVHSRTVALLRPPRGCRPPVGLRPRPGARRDPPRSAVARSGAHQTARSRTQGGWRIRAKLPLIAKGIFITPFGAGPAQRGGHVAGRDIVVPPVLYANVPLGLMNHEAAGAPLSVRPLAFFQGKLNLHIPYEYSFGIRQGEPPNPSPPQHTHTRARVPCDSYRSCEMAGWPAARGSGHRSDMAITDPISRAQACTRRTARRRAW